MDGLKSTNLGRSYWKICDGNLSRKGWQQRSDYALQCILKICGYNNSGIELENNAFLYRTVCDMLIQIKARLMKHTKITDRMCDQELGNTSINSTDIALLDRDNENNISEVEVMDSASEIEEVMDRASDLE